MGHALRLGRKLKRAIAKGLDEADNDTIVLAELVVPALLLAIGVIALMAFRVG